MPFPYQILAALRDTLRGFGKKPAGSLMHEYDTDGEIPCFYFAGDLLQKVAGENYTSAENSTALGPNSGTPEGAFFHFAVQGEPSECNHGFCVYFWNNNAILIQVYVNKPVKLILRMSRLDFLNAMANLRAGNCVSAYANLFGVAIEKFTPHSIQTSVAN
ncbi:hypothetical protein GCM10011611_61050 [Aliidongia dinghuensis]|uniref:Uncharacterized protein n=1 Tax=Aliidongia dinghuensis TaxID=1867774 RepID=A0A8J3E5D0_9PROT|nr:hypothetical protein [Aliidongia dinghuensis]GGF46361.1 hypothetical protein GCM10011611_61050 [Aliidongia dinghuensis]